MLARRWGTCSRPKSTPQFARPRASSPQTHIAPHAPTWEEAEEFPRELYETARGAALTGIGYPEALGGRAATSRTCSSRARSWSSPAARSAPSSASAATASRCRRSCGSARRSRSSASCRRVCAAARSRALAITEPGGGSDVASLTTRAVRDGDHYVVDGAKTFITSRHARRLRDARGAHRRRGPRRHLAARDRARHARLHASARSSRRPAGGRATPPSSHFEGCRVPVANLHRRRERRVPDDHDELRDRAAASRRRSASRSPSSPTASRSPTRASARRSASRSPASRSRATSSPTWRRASPRRARSPARSRRAILRGEHGRRARGDGEEHRDRHVLASSCDQAVQIHGGYGYMREYARRAAVSRRAPLPDRRRHARDHERDHRARRRATDEAAAARARRGFELEILSSLMSLSCTLESSERCSADLDAGTNGIDAAATCSSLPGHSSSRRRVDGARRGGRKDGRRRPGRARRHARVLDRDRRLAAGGVD